MCSENPSIPLCQDLRTGWMLISCVVYSIWHPFFLPTHVGQPSLSKQRMEFQSHDRIVGAELECCLTHNAGPHFAVCTFVAVAEGDDRAACRGAPPEPLPSVYTLTSPLAPTFVFGYHVLLCPCKARPWMGWKTEASVLDCIRPP